MKLEVANAPITIVPPKIANWPGSSPKTAHTSNGAKIDSSKINNDTSGAGRRRGPNVRNVVPTAIKMPCEAYSQKFSKKPINGFVMKTINNADPQKAIGTTGTIEVAFIPLRIVNANP